ncbi:MAG: hypothetical protein ACRDHN_19070, partial [Thermomicrobiales bacterium]
MADKHGQNPVMDALTRRNVLGSMAIAVAAGLVSPAILRSAAAQDATPESTTAEQDVQTAAATPEAALPMIPPEMEEFANDWPMAQGNYAA